jgi:hypothetical protein
VATAERMPDYGDTIDDASGAAHVIESLFTKEPTGFGVIFSTAQPHTLIKVFFKDIDAASVVRRLRGLPIDGLNLVQPVAALSSPYSGYVMRAALAGSQWNTVAPSRGAVWLQALARVTEIVARLHARSLVFGDLNPKNVLVSADGRDALLIDLDTIVREGAKFEASYQTGRWKQPNLAAPDFDGTCAWARQDVWAIAAVARWQWNESAAAVSSVLPRTAPILYDLASGGIKTPHDLPTALELWRSVTADADLLLTCVDCGLATQHDSCSTCGAHLADAELVVDSPHGSSTLRVNAASGTLLQRRHALGGPHAAADSEFAAVVVVGNGLRLVGRGIDMRVPFGTERSARLGEATMRLRARRLGEP